MKTTTLHIDLIYDIICPWCYVGHQRLVNAIKKTNASVAIHLVPYQLRPDLKQEGISIEKYWKDKGMLDIDAAYEKVISAGLSEGLDINPKKISKIPNTLKIHQVILKAEEIGMGLEVLHAIQNGYFSNGDDLTKVDTIVTLTKSYLTKEEVLLAWNDDVYKELVLSKEKQVKDLHVNAVPTYIIDQKHRISGAVSNYMLVDMLTQLAPKNILGEFCDIKTGKC